MSTPENSSHPKKQRVFVRPALLCLLLALVASSCFTPGHDARTKLSIVHSLPMANGACVAWSNGEAYCWGLTNLFYSVLNPFSGIQVGNDVSSPTRMAGDVKRVLPILNAALCVLTEKGRVLCRGRNHVSTIGGATGLLGRGNPTASAMSSYAFEPVVGVGGRGVLSNVVTGTTGRLVACVVLEDTRVACWGSNANRQLGVTGVTNSSIPQIVQWDASLGGGDLTGVIRLTSLEYGFCAELQDGRGACWGDESDGRLGNGRLGSGRNMSLTDGTLARYILGVGEMEGGAPLENIFRIRSANLDSACAIVGVPSDASKRRMVCWGNNADGRLGDGTTTVSTTPVTVIHASTKAPLEDVTYIVPFGFNAYCAEVEPTAGEIEYLCWGKPVELSSGSGNNRTSAVLLLRDTTTSSPLSSASITDGAIPVTLDGVTSQDPMHNFFGTTVTTPSSVIYCLHQISGFKCLGTNRGGGLGQGVRSCLPGRSCLLNPRFPGNENAVYGDDAAETVTALPFLTFRGISE